MKYTDYYKYLKETEIPKGEEGDDWVRPGSDLEPGMSIGKTNFPYGHGYPNYRRKTNDIEDFEEVTQLNHIIDTPHEHSDQDNKKRTVMLYSYIKNKLSNFYQKYKLYIDRLFVEYDNYNDIHHWFIGFMDLAKKEPSHSNVPAELKNMNITDEDIETVKRINNIYHKLYSIIHHRDDPQNELNYPLYVSLYDITRALGGYEEGGWWYDAYELKDSIEIKNPNELLPAAEKLYNNINNIDGKPYIVVEKNKGSQEQSRPTYS
jgi:hypothetical protein